MCLTPNYKFQLFLFFTEEGFLSFVHEYFDLVKSLKLSIEPEFERQIQNDVNWVLLAGLGLDDGYRPICPWLALKPEQNLRYGLTQDEMAHDAQLRLYFSDI